MASLGASCAVFGASWRSRGPLAYLGEPLGASWGSLGSLLEASWAPLGASWGPLGALLGRSWEPSGRSWGHLGGDLSKKGGVLISLAPLECLESPLGPFLRPKSVQNLMKINVFCFLAFSLLEPSWAILDSLGASWGSLGSLLEASWGPLGVSWGHLGASWGALGALLEASWETWRASWSHLGCGRSNEGGRTVVSPPRGPRSL